MTHASHPRRYVSRVAARCAATLVAATALVGMSIAAAPSALAVNGILDVTVDTSTWDHEPALTKTKRATCPTGTRILGGGGGLLTNEADGIVITQMQPVRPLTGLDFFEVTAYEPTASIRDWRIRATAICAPALANMSMAFGNSTLSSNSTHLATAVCPTGRKVVGSGGTIYNANGNAGLQVVRASSDGTRVYAQGHESAAGYSGQWYVFAWAVCATAPVGYQIVTANSPQDDSETTKNAAVDCPGSKTLLGAGAAVSFAAPGAVALQHMHAYSGPTSGTVQAYAAENASTTTDWDFIVAQGICAT